MQQDFEKLSPALGSNPPTEMSSREFQRMLYTWFEEKGLVSDLRSYLRVLMINELRNTNIVIAEHLMREGCHYTLSIFSTEVPGVANHLPVSLYEAHCRNNNWRFNQDSLFNVLELIGISRSSDECLRISSLYSRNRDSLLTCLVNSKTVPEMPELDKVDGDYVHKVLTLLGVPPTMVDTVKSKIYEDVNQQMLLDHRQIQEMECLIKERNNQIRLLLDEQLAQKKETKKLKHELKESQKRLKQSLLQEKNLNLKETHMKKKLDEVTRLQRGLEKTLAKECRLKHCSEQCERTVVENHELRHQVDKLEALNREKTLETERLTAKIAGLLKDLQNSKLNMEFLNSCLVRSSQINLEQKGEEPPAGDDHSDSLPLEVVNQVRARLYSLERESDALDMKFKKLRMN